MIRHELRTFPNSRDRYTNALLYPGEYVVIWCKTPFMPWQVISWQVISIQPYAKPEAGELLL